MTVLPSSGSPFYARAQRLAEAAKLAIARVDPRAGVFGPVGEALVWLLSL